MNRLLGTRTYLVGPIDRCPEGGSHWRDRITPILEDMGVIVFNPLDKPIDTGLETDDYRSRRKVWKANNDFHTLSRVMHTVRCVDLRMVDITDFAIVYLDTDVYPCGTLEELFTGNRSKKPYVVWCPQGKWAVPDWLYGTLPHEMFFETEDQVIDYLKRVDSAPEVDTHNRWMFFDAKRLYKKEVLDRIHAS